METSDIGGVKLVGVRLKPYNLQSTGMSYLPRNFPSFFQDASVVIFSVM
jgi:hypothetical protein